DGSDEPDNESVDNNDIEIQANTIWRTYNKIVPRLGQSIYTPYAERITRSGAGSTAVNNNSSIGGDRTLYTEVWRTWSDPGMRQATERRSIRSGDRLPLRYDVSERVTGAPYRLKHINTAFATVQVQTSGSWTPY
uniref:hypothetical protein n=1 Tax=Halalkalibacillus halophilus TaxID=392827 RepID=UPI000486A804